MLGILVDGEAGRERRDFEQDSTRLAEVNRAEVVAVEDVGDVPTCLVDPLTPRFLLVVRRRPRDVMP
jgi:hypothetical protein